jgi:hypothetical protein
MFEKGRDMATMVLPQAREALLGPTAQKLEIGLLAARTAGVLRRIEARTDVDDVDRVILEAAAAMLANAADAIEGIAAGGQPRRARGSFGFGAMAFTVELAAAAVPESDLPSFLRDMADALNLLRHESRPDLTGQLLPAFSRLAEVATKQAGSVGEGGGALF